MTECYPPILNRFYIEDNKIMSETVNVTSFEHYNKLIDENMKIGKSLRFDFSYFNSEEFRKKDEEFNKNYNNKLKG